MHPPMQAGKLTAKLLWAVRADKDSGEMTPLCHSPACSTDPVTDPQMVVLALTRSREWCGLTSSAGALEHHH